ncbi:MAG: hypothetical protein DRP35_04530 [Candidatus Zixiibacteriota bacterium]|nr:MAG: hypothetical protein DRP35_04530 [candidate division Zixibacteria bacterium]
MEENQRKITNIESLASRGYWPAVAAKNFSEKKYSTVVEICKNKLNNEFPLLSARLLYARALYHAGQIESAENEFNSILISDPDNIVCLKYLGDIKFHNKNDFEAINNYERILYIDPLCKGLVCNIEKKESTVTSSITLVKKEEDTNYLKPNKYDGALASIPFYTETMGDLYMNQGHVRLAAEVFKVIYQKNKNPKIKDKLRNAELKINEKEL